VARSCRRRAAGRWGHHDWSQRDGGRRGVHGGRHGTPVGTGPKTSQGKGRGWNTEHGTPRGVRGRCPAPMSTHRRRQRHRGVWRGRGGRESMLGPGLHRRGEGGPTPDTEGTGPEPHQDETPILQVEPKNARPRVLGLRVVHMLVRVTGVGTRSPEPLNTHRTGGGMGNHTVRVSGTRGGVAAQANAGRREVLPRAIMVPCGRSVAKPVPSPPLRMGRETSASPASAASDRVPSPGQRRHPLLPPCPLPSIPRDPVAEPIPQGVHGIQGWVRQRAAARSSREDGDTPWPQVTLPRT
jgi:hypothetical protein